MPLLSKSLAKFDCPEGIIFAQLKEKLEEEYESF